MKEDVQPKKSKRSASITKRKEESAALGDDDNQVSEDDEALVLAKLVDSDDEADDATPDEEIKEIELPKVSKQVTKASGSDDDGPGVVYVCHEVRDDRWSHGR